MGYAIKLQPQAAQIYTGDKVDVALTGSNTGTFTFTVVYVAKDEVCLLSDSNMGNANWSTACAKSWGWSCKIGGKSYSSSDAGQSVAKIPTLEELYTKCHHVSIPDGIDISTGDNEWTSSTSNRFTNYIDYIGRSANKKLYFSGYVASSAGPYGTRIYISIVR